MELSKEMLQNMEQADIRDAVLDTLTDISKIEIDRNKPIAERVEAYVEAVCLIPNKKIGRAQV